jgi:hypothetical protein
MLLWEEGLIKVEVSRKERKHCHTAPITQFELQHEDLVTVGTYIHIHFTVDIWYNLLGKFILF